MSSLKSFHRTSLGSDGDDNDSREVSNKEDNGYAEQRERIEMIMSSYMMILLFFTTKGCLKCQATFKVFSCQSLC